MFELALKRCILVCVVLLSACSQVSTYVNTFRTQAPEFTSGQFGSLIITPVNESQAASLEFDLYRSKLAEKLSVLGFRVVSGDSVSAEYEANLTYQMVEKEVDTPFDYNTYLGTSYRRRYGANVVVMDRSTQTEFVRSISVIIKRRESQQHLYEVSGVSRGDCGVISVVFDEMLTAMFKNFPADSGSLQKITIKGNTRC